MSGKKSMTRLTPNFIRSASSISAQAIAQRMELIEVLAARFNNDSRMIRRICLEVLDRIASILEPELQSKLDADSRRDMSIAAYLHDIGKSGPFDAPQATQEAIVKLYAVENVADPDQTIAETARTNFSSEDAESMLKRLGSCGLRSNDTMRAFWDRHGYWTHDILEADPEDIPVRARVVAASRPSPGSRRRGLLIGSYRRSFTNLALGVSRDP